MIGVILPTRGLVYTRVEDAIEKMRETEKIKVFRSHDLPIPEAQNFLVQQALLEDVTHLFFIEEDTVPSPLALKALLMADTDIACIDYAVNGYSCVAKDKDTGEVLWCGFGCTLVRKEVFYAMERPWFRVDKTLRLNDWQWVDNPAKYGGQDIWFSMKAREKGFTIKQLPGECVHLQFVEVGRREANNGLHKIVEREKISVQQIVERAVI